MDSEHTSGFTTVIVNYIPDAVGEDQLGRMFSGWAPAHVKLVMNKATGASCGYGFIEFANRDDALKCIDAMNGKEIYGKRLKVTLAKPREEVRFNTNCYIAGVPPTWTIEMFKNMASYFGDIMEYRLMNPQAGHATLSGFVRFARKNESDAAIRVLDGFGVAREGLIVKPDPNDPALPTVKAKLSSTPGVFLLTAKYAADARTRAKETQGVWMHSQPSPHGYGMPFEYTGGVPRGEPDTRFEFAPPPRGDSYSPHAAPYGYAAMPGGPRGPPLPGFHDDVGSRKPLYRNYGPPAPARRGFMPAEDPYYFGDAGMVSGRPGMHHPPYAPMFGHPMSHPVYGAPESLPREYYRPPMVASSGLHLHAPAPPAMFTQSVLPSPDAFIGVSLESRTTSRSRGSSAGLSEDQTVRSVIGISDASSRSEDAASRYPATSRSSYTFSIPEEEQVSMDALSGRLGLLGFSHDGPVKTQADLRVHAPLSEPFAYHSNGPSASYATSDDAVAQALALRLDSIGAHSGPSSY